jgi:hypothetical protein
MITITMKNRKRLLNTGLLVLLLFASNHVYASVNRIIIDNDRATITLKDYIGHPLYWWPNTLLSYEMESNNPIDVAQYILINQQTGKQIPFQIIPVSPDRKKVTLYFMSDLPSKGEYNFVLQKGQPEQFKPVSIEKGSDSYQITTDRFSVRIPSSRSSISSDIPGPVMSISKDGKDWKGRSFFDSHAGMLNNLEVQLISEGPLFAEFLLTYTFSGNSEYKVWIRCVEGYDFIEMKEEMNGFLINKKIHWNIVWDDFSPTHRQAPNHPYGGPKENAKGFGRYDWEKIDQTMLNSHHGINKEVSPDGKIPFDLGIYGNWPAEGNVTSVLFWDENKNESVGIFAKDIAYWNDNQYAIWHDTRDISVKLFYKDGLLRWAYPLLTGTRYTALSFYPHEKDIEYMDRLESLTEPVQNPDGTNYRVKMSQLSYNSFLQNKHSTLDLNKVKDWCLVYPETAEFPVSVFDGIRKPTVKEFEQNFYYGTFSNELAVSGTCQNSGYGPTASRAFYDHYTPYMNILLPEMSKEQRERMIAMFLVHTYIAAGEEYMPMKHMLSGHPNFLSDVKSVPAFASYLFPEHPKAGEWADLFEKYVDLNTHYHSRPDVKSWDAVGGRWTENINTYIWGFIRPSIRANYLLQLKDGKKRMSNENMVKIGSYVMNALSAPFDGGSTILTDMHNWGGVTPENGPQRVIPAQGAHAVRRMLPSAYWRWGKDLEHYDPLLSENMRYIARPEFEDAEMKDRAKNTFNCMYPLDTDDTGTPPSLESIKMTGYGIILRAAVGTKDELSIHLGQVDNGPNYRWGIVGDGGCGTIYFYANGKSYSDNGKEDAGDRRLQDTDMVTGFGVFKDGRFKGIGKSDLSRPLYDLSVGQFAEIQSSEKRQYSWPEYKSRSIMLVGNDYFLIYDDVYNQNMGTRFSWFTRPDEDLPELEVIKGGGANYTYSREKSEYTIHSGRESKGIWFDGTGDFLTFVSHKKGFTNEQTPYGCIIYTPEGNNDYIFRNDLPVEVDENNMTFSGTAGFIRIKPTHKELAIFHGNRIGVDGFEIRTQNEEAGLSALFTSREEMKGQYYYIDESVVTFRWEGNIPANLNIYVDGIKQKAVTNGNEISVTFPAGKHIWNITKGLPDLPKPQIHYTVNKNNKVDMEVYPVPGAKNYRFEYSIDAGKTWMWEKEQSRNKMSIKPQQNERKGYVRISALNSDHISLPSVIYPVYFTSEKPHYPDGLKVTLEDNFAQLTWGKVLGCNEYKVYKKNGNNSLRLIYSGNVNEFIDRQYKKGEVSEYTVSAVNGNGESELCNLVTTDLNSWLNFTPMKGEPFRRVVAKEDPVDNEGNTTSFYYPE